MMKAWEIVKDIYRVVVYSFVFVVVGGSMVYLCTHGYGIKTDQDQAEYINGRINYIMKDRSGA